MTDARPPVEPGDGLVLRRATTADTDALIAFNTLVHAEGDEPSIDAGASTSDLLGKRHPHPATGPDNFTIVEDTATGAIVSSLCLIPQTWNYAGVSFPATLVEMVGTLPEYRNRGLVRRQFEVVHDWCAQRGILVQGIAGIRWYYRQFGYEYAVEFGTGRVARRAKAPKKVDDEPFTLRDAVDGDAAFLIGQEESARGRWLLTSVRDERHWRYEIDGRDPDSDSCTHLKIITRHDGTHIGHVSYVLPPDDMAWIVSFELVEGASWLDVVPVVLRHILAAVDARDGDQKQETFVALELSAEHPSYRAMPDVLDSPRKRYALYIRVPDLPAFIARIAPVLERRLADSPAGGYSGELPINFYRGGIRLVFTHGRLASVVAERLDADAAASLPDLTFLQLLFGYRALSELDAWYPDCHIRTNEARVLLDALFPKQPSFVWPIW